LRARFHIAEQFLQSRHQLDVYLAPHLGHLTDALQQRALQQFCAPFESVAVERMAAAFGWDSEHTLEKLVALIQAGKLEARIDWSRMVCSSGRHMWPGIADMDYAAQVLETKRVDERTALFENAIEVGQKRVRAAKALLLRMELVENG
jgi:COP9 signalosome complex subunit 1